MLSRARAALRLSSLRSENDALLLARIGESQVECGDITRAEATLRRSVAVNRDGFRTRLELADLALRNGKLAHVIHHYRDAAFVAPDKALMVYARREADYYARLNDDEDYLSAELRRGVLFRTVAAPGWLLLAFFFGFAFGMAGIGAALFGRLADRTSIGYVYQVCSFLPAIGLLAGFLPDLERGKSGRKPV